MCPPTTEMSQTGGGCRRLYPPDGRYPPEDFQGDAHGRSEQAPTR